MNNEEIIVKVRNLHDNFMFQMPSGEAMQNYKKGYLRALKDVILLLE